MSSPTEESVRVEVVIPRSCAETAAALARYFLHKPNLQCCGVPPQTAGDVLALAVALGLRAVEGLRAELGESPAELKRAAKPPARRERTPRKGKPQERRAPVGHPLHGKDDTLPPGWTRFPDGTPRSPSGDC